MSKSGKILYVLALALLLPAGVAGAFDLSSSSFEGVVNEIVDIIIILLPILNGFAFLFFFWGLSKFILNANKPEEIKKGKNYMMGGIIALFVLISAQSIIWFISNELEIGGNPDIPNVYLPTKPK